MTEKMIENRVKKLQAIEAQQKELEPRPTPSGPSLRPIWKRRAWMSSRPRTSSCAGRRSSAAGWTARPSRPLSRTCTASSATPALPGASPSHEKGPYPERRHSQQDRSPHSPGGAGTTIIPPLLGEIKRRIYTNGNHENRQQGVPGAGHRHCQEPAHPPAGHPHEHPL